MAKHKKNMGSKYKHTDPQFEREHSGFEGMISEDHKEIANMPRREIMREYRKEDYTDFDNLDDTIKGIDMQIGTDVSHAKRNKSRSKY